MTEISKLVRNRSGNYAYRGLIIERIDEMAVDQHGQIRWNDDFWGKWEIRSGDFEETWAEHWTTLNGAMLWVDAVLDNDSEAKAHLEQDVVLTADDRRNQFVRETGYRRSPSRRRR